MQPEGTQLGLGTLWGTIQFPSWEVDHYLPQIFGTGMMTAGIQTRAAEGTFKHPGAKNAKIKLFKNMKCRPKIKDKLNCLPKVI